MALDDRKLMIFTGLFLAVSVSTIAQYADQITAAFGGEVKAYAVDDVFTVRAGISQPLYVLLNDVGARRIDADEIHVLEGPGCGSVIKSGRTLYYDSDAACAGRQTFTYCFAHGGECRPAEVALHVHPRAGQPAIALRSRPGEEPESGSAVQLGSARDVRPSQTHDALAAATALDRSAPSLPAPLPAQERTIRPAAIAVAADGPVAALPSDPGPVALPRPPIGALDRAALPAGGVDLSLRVVEGGMATDMATDQDGIATAAAGRADQPAGADLVRPSARPCSPDMTAEARPGAMIAVSMRAPCHPLERVVIVHDRVAFTMRTGPDGRLGVDIPALSSPAGVAVRFPDGTTIGHKIAVPDIADYARISIQWSGAHDLDLHALEFGAQPGSGGHVWSGQPRSVKQALRFGGGFLVALGDTTVEQPMQAEIYSYRRTGIAASGVIRLAVEVQGGAQDCGQPVIMFAQRSLFGHADGTNGLQLTTPACGSEAQSIILQSAVRDLMLARR